VRFCRRLRRSRRGLGLGLGDRLRFGSRYSRAGVVIGRECGRRRIGACLGCRGRLSGRLGNRWPIRVSPRCDRGLVHGGGLGSGGGLVHGRGLGSGGGLVHGGGLGSGGGLVHGGGQGWPCTGAWADCRRAGLYGQCRPGASLHQRSRRGCRDASGTPVAQHRQPQAEAEDGQSQRKSGDDPGGGLVRQLQAHGVVDVRRADQRTGHEHREPGVAAGPPACLAQGDRGRAGDQENGVEDDGVSRASTAGTPAARAMSRAAR
jgi:hypothetical protein